MSGTFLQISGPRTSKISSTNSEKLFSSILRIDEDLRSPSLSLKIRETQRMLFIHEMGMIMTATDYVWNFLGIVYPEHQEVVLVVVEGEDLPLEDRSIEF